MKVKTMLVLAGLLGAGFARAADEVVDTTVYVESDGSQYIDLGYPLSSDMEVEIVATIKNNVPVQYRGLFGARTEADVKNFSAAVDSNAGLGFMLDCNDEKGECLTYRADVVYSKGVNLSFGTPYRIVIGAQSRSVVGQPRSNSTPIKTSFTTAGNAYVFAVNGMPSSNWGKAAAKVHLVRIRQNGAILHEYLPACKDGVFGLSDVVGDGGFKTSAVGNPLLGKIKPLSVLIDLSEPTIYEWGMKSFVTVKMLRPATTTVTTVVRPIDYGASYVQSDGTQEIDLGFKLKSDMNIEVVFAGVGVVPASQGFFGARGSGASVRNIALFRGKDDEGGIVSADCQNGNYESYRMNNASVATGVVYRATLKNGAWTLTDEKSGTQIGKSSKAWDGATFETPGNALLFRINGTTIDNSIWALAQVRIYSVVVRDKDGALLHDLIPSMNAAGVAGFFDRAVPDAADAWKLPKPGGGVNPLVLGDGRIAPDAPRVYTNVVGRVDDSCELPVTIRPLRPGTVYEWFAFAEDQRGDFACSLTTNTLTTVSDAAPAGATLSLKVEVLLGGAKAGHLRLRLTRTDTANAAAVTLVGGKDYGGADPATWRNVNALGSFAVGEAVIMVDTPFLPKDTNYLRVFTADGEWSETVFIPETGFVPGKQGLAVIFR